MTKLQKRLSLALAAVAAFYLFLWQGLPPILKSVALSKASEALGRPVALKAVEVNPFTLEVKLAGLEIRERDSKALFAGFDSLHLDFEISSLYRRALVVKKLSLVNPVVNVTRDAQGVYNFADILESGKKVGGGADGEAKKPADPARFYLGNLLITGGRATYDNRAEGAKHELSAVELFIPVVSNLPIYLEEFAKPRLSFSFDGSSVNLEGRTKPFNESHETEFDIKVAALDLLKYLPYSPLQPAFAVKSAFAEVDLVLGYVQRREGVSSLVARGKVALSKVELTEKSGEPLLSFARASAVIAPSDLLAGKLEISSVEVDAPSVRVVRQADATFNLAKLGEFAGAEAKAGSAAPAKAQAAGKTSPEGAKFEVVIRKLALGPGRVDFEDRTAKPRFALSLPQVAVEAQDLDLAKGSVARAALKITGDEGETLAVDASGTWEPPNLLGAASIANLRLTRFSPYYADALPVTLVSGKLASAGAKWEWRGGSAALLTEALVNLEALAAAKKSGGEPFATLRALKIENAGVDLAARQLALGRVTLEAPTLKAELDAYGNVDLANLAPTAGPGSAPAPTAAAPLVAGAAKEQSGWGWALEKLAVKGGEVAFTDARHTPPVAHAVSAIEINAAEFSSKVGQQGRISLAALLEKSGRLKLDGTAGVAPPTLDAELRLDALALATANPYLAEFTRAAIASGTASLTGRAKFARPEGGEAAWSFDGSAGVGGLAVVDGETAAELVRLGVMSLSGVHLASSPRKFAVEGITLADPWARVELNADGRMNFAGLVKNAGATGGETAGGAKPAPRTAEANGAGEWPVEIGALSVTGGTLEFADFRVKPNYRVTVGDLAGSVSRLSTFAAEGGEVSLLGSVDGYAPLEIQGRVNPFPKNFLVDLNVEFRNVDVSPFSPYSSRYLGYRITKGKLGLKLNYKIVGRELASQNRVVIDQLTLGDRTPNPDELSIPVRFALALLTDRNGVIELDVPVAGTLDDPDFSWGRVIWRVVGNLLVKAVTSPFSLLGSLFGGGADLSAATFEPGKDALTPEATATLDRLAKALADRPALKLDIAGLTDPEKDRDALRARALVRKIKAAKLRQLLKPPATAPGTAQQPAQPAAAMAPTAPTVQNAPLELDAVEYTGEERAGLIAAAFEEEKLPKPPAGGKALTGEEMEKLLITAIPVGEEELGALAARRSRAALDYLVEKAKVDAGRVFVVEASKEARDKKPDGSRMRVEFSLK